MRQLMEKLKVLVLIKDMGGDQALLEAAVGVVLGGRTNVEMS